MIIWGYYEYKGLIFYPNDNTVSENRKCDLLLKVKIRKYCGIKEIMKLAKRYGEVKKIKMD